MAADVDVAASSGRRFARFVQLPCTLRALRPPPMLLAFATLLLGCPAPADSSPKDDGDADGDGFSTPADCDDADGGVYPGANEVCDGVDNDCDDTVDDDADGAPTWYADADADGWGDATAAEAAYGDGDGRKDASPTMACDAPAGWVAGATDCDDTDADVHPGATELCNERDDDCDGTIDPDSSADAPTWYADSDGDGFGAGELVGCEAPSGFVDGDGDCDDTDANVHPGATELCNERDDDCDGTIDPDSSADAFTFHADYDHDGYGDAGTATVACSAPSGFVDDARDCDDDAVDVHPGATESCNGHDDDCDGLMDPPTSLGVLSWNVDADGDGYGDADATVPGCTAPDGSVADDTDCDDTKAGVNPGATEVCDAAETDEDCDGLPDDLDTEVSGTSTWYPDDDNDGFGAMAGDPTYTCDQPVSTATVRGDCDDDDARRNPDGWPCTLDVPVTEAIASLTGTTGEYFSYAMHGGDDYNLDGEPDYVIGAYRSRLPKGAAYLVFGPISGTATVASVADATFSDSSVSYVGASAPDGGDLDGDGRDDLLIHATIGGLYGFYAPVAGGTTLAEWDIHLSLEVPADPFGGVVGGVDFDGDGHEDVALADNNWPASTTYQGTAYVTFGPFSGERSMADADLIARGEAAGDNAGGFKGLAANSDLDGDGLVELFVGANYNDAAGSDAGAAYVIAGGTTGLLSLADADARITGNAAGDYFAELVQGGGDLDGDGYDDLVVGATRYGGYAGGAWVYSGALAGAYTRSDALTALIGETTYDYIGGDALPLQDLDGDGHDDLVVGALLDYTCGNADGSGSVYIFRGPISGSLVCEQADTVLAGTKVNGRFSEGLSTAGDADGDGFTDLLVGAYLESGGAMRLYSGVDL